MTVPAEFRRLARLFLQDSAEDAQGMPEFVALAIELLNREDVPGAKEYLDRLLLAGIGEEELDQIWKSCRPNYWIREGEMREFFTEIRKQLGVRLNADTKVDR